MLILAPMQGLTELLFRRAFERAFPGAFDYAVSPFISLTHGNLRDAEKKIDDVLPERNRGSMRVVPQILGHEVGEFVDLANRLYDLGYEEVNWNIGCPMRRVAGKHRGSGILPYPEEVRAVLEGVVRAMRPRLSVKMRLGYRSANEIDSIVPILNDYPLANVTIHPRIGKQMYSGTPDLKRFAEVLPMLKHKVIYNGDICSLYDYERIRRMFPTVKDVMIGRGVLYNPLLPIEIRRAHAEGLDGVDGVDGFEDNGKNFNVNLNLNFRYRASHENYNENGKNFNDNFNFNFRYRGGESNGEGAVGTASEFIVSMMEGIMELDVSREAKMRKMKEYWCLFGKAVPGSEERKRRVLHADRVEEVLALILEMTK